MHSQEWTRLIRGAELLDSQRLRPTSVKQYDTAIRTFTEFCTQRGARSLPTNPVILRSFIYYQTQDRSLDPGYVATQISAISDWYKRQARMLATAGFPAPQNPATSLPVSSLLAIARKNFKRSRKGRQPITRHEFVAMMRRGFDLQKASGHHRRVSLLLSTLACLRRGALAHLRVAYTIEGRNIVFLPTSDVQICYSHDTYFPSYIRMRINKDKNVSATDEVYAYIPHFIPAMGLRPVELLRYYIMMFRPPSGSLYLVCSS